MIDRLAHKSHTKAHFIIKPSLNLQHIDSIMLSLMAGIPTHIPAACTRYLASRPGLAEHFDSAGQALHPYDLVIACQLCLINLLSLLN